MPNSLCILEPEGDLRDMLQLLLYPQAEGSIYLGRYKRLLVQNNMPFFIRLADLYPLNSSIQKIGINDSRRHLSLLHQ
ncbi:hypothetical protein D1872_295500 [compost metagenome]